MPLYIIVPVNCRTRSESGSAAKHMHREAMEDPLLIWQDPDQPNITEFCSAFSS